MPFPQFNEIKLPHLKKKEIQLFKNVIQLDSYHMIASIHRKGMFRFLCLHHAAALQGVRAIVRDDALESIQNHTSLASQLHT